MGGLHGGMWAVVFTDMVESTRQRARIGDPAADEIRRAHDVIVRRVAEARGGHVVKGLGDGAMVAFGAAHDALAAAGAIQQEIELHNRTAPEPLALRIGISLGDVEHEDGDLHGMAVTEAARVCAAARPGTILLTDVVRVVAGSRAAVLAIYAGLDDRVNASRDRAVAALEAAGLTYEVQTYDGADHAFFNDTGPRYNAEAATDAYRRVLAWFRTHLT